MVKVEEYEEIRKRYFVDGWSIRKINRELKHCRRTIRKAIVKAEPEPYKLEKARGKPVLGPYQAKIEKLVAKNKELPRKQRYTARKIFLEIKKDGYVGSEGNVRRYVAELKKDQQKGQAYLPLAFDAGEYAQVDWGEAEAVIARKRVTVQFFVMRLNYSRMRFVMAFPFQKQEAFFEGHIQGFRFFGGVPRNVTYDNLKTAVFRILEGKNRQEQTAFTDTKKGALRMMWAMFAAISWYRSRKLRPTTNSMNICARLACKTVRGVCGARPNRLLNYGSKRKRN
jgi:transposase